jgi:hypothetical protein
LTPLETLINKLDLVEVDMIEKKPTKTIAQIQKEFAQPWPSREKTKTLKGNRITYLPWYEVVSIANAVTEGHWDYEVVHAAHSPETKKFEMRVKVTIYAADGAYSREGTGSEDSATDNYGDYQSIAESMAFRRAFTKFQLGTYMYRK